MRSSTSRKQRMAGTFSDNSWQCDDDDCEESKLHGAKGWSQACQQAKAHHDATGHKTLVSKFIGRVYGA